MPYGSYRTTDGRLVWRLGVAVTLALQLLAALALGKKVYVYMVQEVLVMVLLVAVSVAAILLLLVAFVLFREGIRRAALWAKTWVARVAGSNHRHRRHSEPMVHLHLRR